MERKELLKKLNELKRSVVAISLASTVILGASACSNEEKPYFSEELSMEDYFNSKLKLFHMCKCERDRKY